jgi:hypothetical protein
VDPEHAGFIASGGHHATLGGVAAATYHHRLPSKFGPPQYFYGCHVLIEVDVEDP